MGKITKDTEYIARFSINESTSYSYTIKYDANGGTNTPASQIKNKNKDLILTDSIPTNEKYVFMGWMCAYDDNLYQSGARFSIDANVTLYAIWGHTCSGCSGSGTITSGNNGKCLVCGGSGKTTSSTTWGKCSSCNGSGKLSNSSLCSSCKGLGGKVLCTCSSGHSWYQNDGSRKCPSCGKYSISSQKITTCSTCNGSGQVKKYITCGACGGKGNGYTSSSVSCRACGGTGSAKQNTTCNDCNGAKAIKNETQSFTVSLNDGKSIIASDNVALNEPYKFVVPTKNGYSFDGWFDSEIGGNRFTYSDGISIGTWDIKTNKTLYAHWILNYYLITYEIDESVVLADMPSIYTVEDEVALSSATKKGYTLNWTINGKAVTAIDASLAKDVVIKGIWIPIEYKITYELNSGTNNSKNPTSYTVEDEIILYPAQKSEYAFIYWTIDDVIIEKIEAGSIWGDIHLVANYCDTSNLDLTLNSDGTLTLKKVNKDATSVIIYEKYDGHTVISIGDSAFEDCSSLTSITIPDGVTSIGRSAFSSCSSLKSITMPDSVTSIGNEAFEGCSSLTTIAIPNSVTSIGSSAFSSCSSLTSITIPDGVTNIGDYAFFDCSSLTSITIPDGVTSIGRSAFYDCEGLTSITIPNSVTNIGEGVFKDCSSLTSITFTDTTTWYITENYSDWENKEGGIATSVADSSTNVTHFESTHVDY